MKSQAEACRKVGSRWYVAAQDAGKSLLAMEFLVHGAVRYGEPGVCMDFEETEEKLSGQRRIAGL